MTTTFGWIEGLQRVKERVATDDRPKQADTPDVIRYANREEKRKRRLAVWRYAHWAYLPEKREALTAWSEFLADLVRPRLTKTDKQQTA